MREAPVPQALSGLTLPLKAGSTQPFQTPERRSRVRVGGNLLDRSGKLGLPALLGHTRANSLQWVGTVPLLDGELLRTTTEREGGRH